MPDEVQEPTESAEDLALDQTDDDETPLVIEPEKRRVKTDKQDVPVETLRKWVQRGKLNLQPEFQRHYVWTPSKASRLIESLLLDIPIPVIYVAEEAAKNY